MNKKKIMALTMAAVMSAGVLSGCEKKPSPVGTPEVKIKGKEADLAYRIAEKPLELSLFYAGTLGFDVFNEAGRLTNVYLKNVVPSTSTDKETAYTTMVSSKDMADLVSYDKANIEKYAFQGAFVKLDEYLEEYAPNITKYLNDHPEKKANITSADGHIYIIPRFEDGDTAQGWYIRQDWLDKLGLEQPKTVDEYYKVLTAFKTQDPNGNGQADEVPFFQRDMLLSTLYPLWGITPDFYVDEATQTIKHGMYSPEYKKAIKDITKWYKEGLIDQEIFTRGSNSREELLGSDTGGSTHDWFTSTGTYNEKLKEKVPGINFAPIAPPADINGKVWERTSRNIGALGWGISSSCKNIEEAVKYLDFWFSEPGTRLYNYGIEGTHYNMVDGKPVVADLLLKSDKSMTENWWNAGISIYIGAPQTYESEAQFITNPDIQKGIDLYTQNGYCAPKKIEYPFTPEERAIIATKWVSIQTYMKEMEQKWVLGASDVDATFDEYMNYCKTLEMDNVLEIYNNAYSRYKKFSK